PAPRRHRPVFVPPGHAQDAHATARRAQPARRAHADGPEKRGEYRLVHIANTDRRFTNRRALNARPEKHAHRFWCWLVVGRLRLARLLARLSDEPFSGTNCLVSA